MTPTHEEVLAAIDKARRTDAGKYGLIAEDWLRDRNTHCDDLRALMDLGHEDWCYTLHESCCHARKVNCPKGHPYDEDNTYLYRGARYCRACWGEM